MPSANQKRIEELENQLAQATRKLQEAEAKRYELTAVLEGIAHADKSVTADALKAQASLCLTKTQALQWQHQRTLAIAARSVDMLKFPVAIRKMWSGAEVQEWLNSMAEVMRQRATAELEKGKETLQ